MTKSTQSILCTLLILIGSALSTRDSVAQVTLHTLVSNGPLDRRINIVILSEGYTTAQKTQFIADAETALNSILAVSPWSEYQAYVNGFAIFVASAQSGADDPSASIYRNTYFNSTFDSYAIDRLLTIPPNNLNSNYADGYGKVYSLLASYMPSYDIVLILVNDQQYGGSGGTFAISSLHNLSPDIVIHELGHSHARLGDEYTASYPGYPDIEEPNTTQQTQRNLIKWNSWISPSVPVPTPATQTYSNTVGLFEGAHYHLTNWYRPCLTCKMKTFDAAFCPVCVQSHILANYVLISPIDSILPALSSITIANGESKVLRVIPMQPPAFPLMVRWFSDGVPIGTYATSLTVSAGLLGAGVSSVKCVVTDTTSFVRVDPTQILRDSVVWTVTVNTSCDCSFHGDPNGDGVSSNILDIVRIVDIAHRGAPVITTGSCPYADVDLDCDGVVDVSDVVYMVSVAFRGASAESLYCNPCQ